MASPTLDWFLGLPREWQEEIWRKMGVTLKWSARVRPGPVPSMDQRGRLTVELDEFFQSLKAAGASWEEYT